MTLFDWVMSAVLAYSAIQAFLRGLVREAFSLCGLIAGILAASWYYPRLAGPLGRFISNPAIASAVAFLAIAIGIMLLAAILGRMVHATAHAVGLGFSNRLGGAVFGLLRGCLLGVAALMAISAFLPDVNWIKNSRLAPYFLAGAHAVSFVVPQDLEQLIRNGVSQIKHNTADWIKLHS